MSEEFDSFDDAMNYYSCENDEIFSPENIAWKLLFDDTKQMSAGLQTFSFENDNDGDPATFTFEILLTIYLEMIVGFYRTLHLGQKEEKGETITTDDFALDLDNINEEVLLNPFRDSLLKVNYFLKVREISTSEKGNYYCKILLRDNPDDKPVFKMNRSIDKDKKYTFILNSSYKRNKNLEDVYSVVTIKGKTYRVSFDRMGKLVQSRCV